MELFIQQLLNGLSAGSQYALWAVGYGLVYQVLGLMHFAHGDTILVGAFLAFTFLVTVALPLPIALLLVIAATGLLAVLVERSVYRPLVVRGETMAAFIAALGAAYILRNVVALIWGNEPKVFPSVLPQETIQIGGVYLSIGPLFSLGVAVVVVVAFTAFLRTSRHGQAILAIAQDRTVASLMGIPTARLITLVYVLSAAIGVIGAVLFLDQFATLRTTTGFLITMKAFVAAIVGGIGRIEGAIIGGLLIGVFEAMMISYVSSLYSSALVFGLLTVLLIIRPRGLVGRRELIKL